MGVTYEEIETYLSDVKTAIYNDRYRIENNLKRLDNREKTVSLYIKFNKLENCFVIVISFHKQKYPLKYYFK